MKKYSGHTYTQSHKERTSECGRATPGAPWYMTTKMPGFKWADKIGDGIITDYFESHVNYPPPKGGELLVLPSSPSLA